MERPRLKAHLRPFTLGDRVFLVAEQRHYLVQGQAAVAVLPYLDGRHTVGEIVTALEGEASFSDVVLALTKYQRFGHLADGLDGHGGGNGLDRRAVAAWDLRGLDPRAAAARLAATTVTVTTVGDADPGEVAAALRGTGVTVRLADGDEAGGDPADPDGPALAVVVTDEYLDPQLGKLDAAFRAAERRWLLVKPVGAEVWAGPVFVPGETGCWQCLAQRLDGNRMVEQYLRFRSPSDLGVIRVSLAALPSSRQLAAALVAAAVTELAATGACPSLEGTLVSLQAQTLQLAHHQLVRQPQCPGCGDPALTSERPAKVTLRSQPVAFGREGGHRVMRPDETYKRLERHISPITGMVRELSSLNEADEGITYSYAAGHNFALPSDNIAMLRRNLRGQSGGKGRTDIQARVSGMCEAIERYAGVWRDDRPTVQGSFDELGADKAVFLPELLGYSAAQYAERARWNQSPGAATTRCPAPTTRASRSPGRRSGRSPTSGSGWSRPPTPGSGTPTSTSTCTASPAATATPPATCWRRRCYRRSASWPSATRWRCGGTTACAGRAWTSTGSTTPTSTSSATTTTPTGAACGSWTSPATSASPPSRRSLTGSTTRSRT